MEAASAEKHTVRVLIADDSPTVRLMLRRILDADPGITVIGQAGNGREAVEKVASLKPDLVTMDVEMPVMDGIKAIEQIMAYTPVPVLVVSSVAAEHTANAAKAMGAGAVDVFCKPGSASLDEFEAKANTLRNKIKLLSRVRVIAHPRGRFATAASAPRPVHPGATAEVVAIASSTGGPQALNVILKSLPANFHAAIVIVQHIAEGFTDGLVEWLGGNCRMLVKKGRQGDDIVPGQVIIAPDSIHMIVSHDHRIALVNREIDSPHKPSADVLLESVAQEYGARSLGVILTGMGRDGARGIQAIHDSGGHTLAQNEETSVIFSMAREAIKLNAVENVIPLEQIGPAIGSYVF